MGNRIVLKFQFAGQSRICTPHIYSRNAPGLGERSIPKEKVPDILKLMLMVY